MGEVAVISANNRAFILLNIVFIMGTIAVGQGRSLLELARRYGDLEGMIKCDCGAFQEVDELVKMSHIIVAAELLKATSYLDEGGTTVSTDYEFRMINPAVRGAVLPPGVALTVKRQGGVVVVEGHRISLRDDSFPNFRPGERYLIFLKYDPASGRYLPVSPQGVFAIVDGKVRYFAETGPFAGSPLVRYNGMTLQQFTEEIRSLAGAQSENGNK